MFIEVTKVNDEGGKVSEPGMSKFKSDIMGSLKMRRRKKKVKKATKLCHSMSCVTSLISEKRLVNHNPYLMEHDPLSNRIYIPDVTHVLENAPPKPLIPTLPP